MTNSDLFMCGKRATRECYPDLAGPQSHEIPKHMTKIPLEIDGIGRQCLATLHSILYRIFFIFVGIQADHLMVPKRLPLHPLTAFPLVRAPVHTTQLLITKLHN